MAVYPCDFSAHRYPGPQRSLYVTAAIGSTTDTYKMRLCERHFRETLEVVGKHFARVEEESQISAFCDSCAGEKAYAVFAKLYDQGQDAEQYATDLCPTCWETLRVLLHVSNGRLM